MKRRTAVFSERSKPFPTESKGIGDIDVNEVKNGRFCGTGNPSPTVIRNAVAQWECGESSGSSHPSTIAMVQFSAGKRSP